MAAIEANGNVIQIKQQKGNCDGRQEYLRAIMKTVDMIKQLAGGRAVGSLGLLARQRLAWFACQQKRLLKFQIKLICFLFST